MIIVSGLPGSGKSYFASRLSERLKAKYVSSDLTRNEMDARGEYAFDDKLDVYEEMAGRVGDHLRQGEAVVVDATFYRREMRNLFFALAKLLHQAVIYIEVVADEILVHARLSQPRLHSEADVAVYELVKPQYERLDVDHLVLKSTDDNIEEMLRKGEEYIKKVDAGI